jgi:hypothetical protein
VVFFCRSLTFWVAVVLLCGVGAGECWLTTEGVGVFLHTCFAFLFFLSLYPAAVVSQCVQCIVPFVGTAVTKACAAAIIVASGRSCAYAVRWCCNFSALLGVVTISIPQEWWHSIRLAVLVAASALSRHRGCRRLAWQPVVCQAAGCCALRAAVVYGLGAAVS